MGDGEIWQTIIVRPRAEVRALRNEDVALNRDGGEGVEVHAPADDDVVGEPQVPREHHAHRGMDADATADTDGETEDRDTAVPVGPGRTVRATATSGGRASR